MKHILLTWLLGVLLLPWNAFAAEPALSPGDEVLILIPEGGDLQRYKVTLDLDGKVALGLYGHISLKGQTPQQATTTIKAATARWLANTEGLHVTLVERRMLLLMTGHVARPGVLRLPLGTDAWSAVQAAGGPKPGAALADASILRKGQRIPVDLHSALTQGVAAPKMRSGDTLFLPAATTLGRTQGATSAWLTQDSVRNKIFVLGAVKAPGLHERSPSMTPWLALGAAQGPATDANLAHVRVIADGVTQDLDLTRPGATLPPTTSGIILYVPSVSERGFGAWARVLGHVKAPGFTPITPDTRLVDALTERGGPTPSAATDRVTLVRQGDGFTLAATYDVGAYARRGGLVGQVHVQPGDLIHVDGQDQDTVRVIARALSDVAIVSAAFTLLLAL